MMTWPKPVQKHPPIIVGGAFRLAARRAIRYGDGLLPAGSTFGCARWSAVVARGTLLIAHECSDTRSTSQ
jgi:alkanesulfonate monooxygenase SsuD/methylene tetrahydromethanopterin reductase-like flavin-dependent oxidoreductase (luciferase family)